MIHYLKPDLYTARPLLRFSNDRLLLANSLYIVFHVASFCREIIHFSVKFTQWSYFVQ